MNAQRSQSPLLLTLFTVGLLTLLSFWKPTASLFGFELRPVRLLADVLPPEAEEGEELPAQLAIGPLPPPNGPAAPLDSVAGVAAGAAPDSVGVAVAAATDSARVTSVPNLGGLTSFVAALRAAKRDGQAVRVAYFGDSMIEGDLITGTLRDLLQREFGGVGVGFVPINSITAEFRETIHQTFSRDWQPYDLVSRKLPPAYPLGISGHVFLTRPLAAKPAAEESLAIPELTTSAVTTPPIAPAASAASAGKANAAATTVPAETPAATPKPATEPTTGSWVQYQAGTKPLGSRLRLFYGKGGSRDAVLVRFNGGPVVSYALPGNSSVNVLELAMPARVRTVRLTFATPGTRAVYGTSFDGPAGGATVDNFSFRGNSGMPLGRISERQLVAFNKALNYQLVILHYGVNIADARNKTYIWYADAMGRVVRPMKRAMPQTSFLIIGMSDKSRHINGEYHTDPSVPRLLKAQQLLAQREKLDFWNLYEAMGGEDSMPDWVNARPALANKDYTHVNYQGGHKIAKLLFDYLMGEYARPTAPPATTTTSAVPPAAAVTPDSAVQPSPISLP